jgi:Flp pilus assembly protein TadD
MKASWLVMILCGLLSGCGSGLPGRSAGQSGGDCPFSRNVTQVQLTLIDQQMAEGKYYSALASLDGLGDDSARARLLRADLLRLLGHAQEAERLYLPLQQGCLEGPAQHGLALLYAERNDLARSVRHFRLAVAASPTDTGIRNDFGFVLLSLGHYQQARLQLMTALELAPEHQVAARNLWFLLLKEGEQVAADSLAHRFGWGEQDRRRFAVAAAHFQPLHRGTL